MNLAGTPESLWRVALGELGKPPNQVGPGGGASRVRDVRLSRGLAVQGLALIQVTQVLAGPHERDPPQHAHGRRAAGNHSLVSDNLFDNDELNEEDEDLILLLNPPQSVGWPLLGHCSAYVLALSSVHPAPSRGRHLRGRARTIRIARIAYDLPGPSRSCWARGAVGVWPTRGRASTTRDRRRNNCRFCTTSERPQSLFYSVPLSTLRCPFHAPSNGQSRRARVPHGGGL
jgi:hypothetical protein